MANEIQGRKIAILATDGVEQSELTEPRKAVEQAGADTDLISPDGGSLKAWKHTDWGDEFEVDLRL
jgi:protease I